MTRYEVRKAKLAAIEYFENVAQFRDYRFKSARFFGKTSIRSSINLLNPDQRGLEDALDVFTRDGFGQIIIYLGNKKVSK